MLHKTDSGYIELLDKFGHGKPPRGDWYRRPGTIVIDDGDGHYTAWSFTGRKVDAICVAAEFDAPETHQYKTVVEGNAVYFEGVN